jgi:hypothetical protein
MTNNSLEFSDNKASASSSLVAEKSELKRTGVQQAASRENSAGADLSENIMYLATDPAL